MVIGGGVLGLVSLVRREALLPGTGIIAAIAFLHAGLDWHRLIRAGLWVGLAMGLVLTPWLVRNWCVLGKPIMSSSGGVVFMGGNNPLATGGYSKPPAEWAAQLKGLDELARNEKAWELSLSWIRNYPSDFIRLLPRKLILLWGPTNNWILNVGDGIMLLLCLFGLIRVIQTQKGWQTVVAIVLPSVALVTFIGLVFKGGLRFRLAAYPGLLLLAAFGFPERWLTWGNHLWHVVIEGISKGSSREVR